MTLSHGWLRPVSLVLLLSFSVSCSTVPAAGETGPKPIPASELDRMYESLATRYQTGHISDTGYERSAQAGSKAAGVIWMTSGGRVGAGVVASITHNHTLLSSIKTKVLYEVRIIRLKKGKDILLVREVTASGTGLHEETVSLFHLEDLSKPLWSKPTYRYEYGPYPEALQINRTAVLQETADGVDLYEYETIETISDVENSQSSTRRNVGFRRHTYSQSVGRLVEIEPVEKQLIIFPMVRTNF